MQHTTTTDSFSSYTATPLKMVRKEQLHACKQLMCGLSKKITSAKQYTMSSHLRRQEGLLFVYQISDDHDSTC